MINPALLCVSSNFRDKLTFLEIVFSSTTLTVLSCLARYLIRTHMTAAGLYDYEL